MKANYRILALMCLVATAFLVGCGGSGGSSASSNPPAGDGAMTVHLVDAPTVDYQAINVDIARVDIGGDSGWLTLAMPNQVYDLLQLTDGLSETLANGATLPVGHFSQLRLILGPDNTVTLADGSTPSLTVPSGMQTGIKMNIDIYVAANEAADVWIDFDASRSIQLHQAGASQKYILRPVIRAFAQGQTGTITGTLTDGAGAPLAGVTVYAETVDGSGHPSIARGTFTDMTGAYTLDLLPLGSSYYVVSAPIVSGASTADYIPKSSAAIALSTTVQNATADLAFAPASGAGFISGTLTVTANTSQSDVVNLLQPLGAGGQLLIVANAVAVVASAETYGFASVATGSYSAQAVRSTDNGDGTTSQTLSGVVGPAAVASGTTTVMDISGL
jgi:hypothetical protein